MRKKFNKNNLSEIVFGTKDTNVSTKIAALIKEGKLRKLFSKVYLLK